jgi:hypothetical protein
MQSASPLGSELSHSVASFCAFSKGFLLISIRWRDNGATTKGQGMAPKAGRKTTASAKGRRTDPVTLDEALERLLPFCDANPFAVADWLNAQHRLGKIRLFGNDIEIPPADNMAGLYMILADHLPNGQPHLKDRIHIKWHPSWFSDNGPVRPVTTFERESFEAHFPGAPKNLGGRPPVYDRERILIEAAVSVYEDGLPGPFTLEKFAAQVAARLGDGAPSSTWLENLLRPLWKRLDTASGQ